MTYIIVIVCIGMLVSIYYISADITDKVFIVITVKLCDIGRRTTASVLIVMGRFACMPFACMLVFGHIISARILVTFSITVAIKVLCKVRRSHTTAGIIPTMTYIIVIVCIGMLVFGHNVSASITDIVTIFIIMRYSSMVVGASARIVFKMSRFASGNICDSMLMTAIITNAIIVFVNVVKAFLRFKSADNIACYYYVLIGHCKNVFPIVGIGVSLSALYTVSIEFKVRIHNGARTEHYSVARLSPFRCIAVHQKSFRFTVRIAYGMSSENLARCKTA